MSALFSLLVQIASIIAGIYIAIEGSFLKGIGLPLAVWVLHVAFSKLSNFFMWFHQKRVMNPFERAMLEADFGLVGHGAKVPVAWGRIAAFCGWAYALTCVCLIWYAVATSTN